MTSGHAVASVLVDVTDAVDGVLKYVSWCLFALAVLFMAYRWNKESDVRLTFARYHASAAARVVDSVSWGLWHLLRAFKGEGTREHRIGAAWCFGAFFLVVLCPVLAVLLTDAGVLKRHGYAFGFAGLTWGLVTERVGQPERDVRYKPAGTTATRSAQRGTASRAALLVVVEVLLYLLLRIDPGLGDQLRAGLTGVVLVGMADMFAVLSTFVAGSLGGFPFAPSRAKAKNRRAGDL